MLEKLFGEDTVEAILREIPADKAEKLSRSILLASSWYPIRLYQALHLAAQKVTGQGPELSEKIGYLTCKEDFTGIYKVYFRIATVNFIFKQGAAMFGRYYKNGKAQVIKTQDKSVHLVYHVVGGFDYSLWRDILGGTRALLELTGSKLVELKVLSGGDDGDREMEVLLCWE
ncbi:MAG: hypothetical protein JXB88_11060 [Spirochaetales bacterium]|nr:hypothetical protein [Spirochaetales bacterium]